MRIFSQDGKLDFPYERVCLEVSDSGKIFVQGDIWGAGNNYIEVARYENEAKARKAMEMLHEKYSSINVFLAAKINMIPPKIFKFPSEYEVDKVLEKVKCHND